MAKSRVVNIWKNRRMGQLRFYQTVGMRRIYKLLVNVLFPFALQHSAVFARGVQLEIEVLKGDAAKIEHVLPAGIHMICKPVIVADEVFA